jgi:hypothetical protein
MAKTFNKNGKWIDKPGKLVIHECEKCENKYVKTRRNQKFCLPCIAEEKMLARP